MKILLFSAYFPPEIGSASHLFYELGESLVSRGHNVSVVTGFPRYNLKERPKKYRRKLVMREIMAGMSVHRWPVISLPRRLMIGRALDHFFMAASFFIGGLLAGPHDLIVVYSPPLPLGLSAWLISKLRRSRFVLNIQDLFPQSIIDLGLLKNKVVIRAFKALERFLYRYADAVTVHSEGNREYIIRSGGSEHRIAVLPNWVDTETIRPSERANGFRREYDLDGKFIVTFAGVMGYSQALDSVIDAAQQLQGQSEILFLLVGDGVEKPRLMERAKDMQLDNVRFIPMQSRERYPGVLAASDVCLVTLREDVKTPVVPSKIPTIMAAARPMIASMPLDGDGPQLVRSTGSGLVISPEDATQLSEAILELYRSEELRDELGRKGRRFAEEHLSREACVANYERLFTELSGGSQ